MATAARGIFPIEILENILSFLNGKALLRMRSVSSVWKETVDDLMRRYEGNDWRLLCFQSIPTNSLMDYLEMQVPGAMQQTVGNNDFDKVNWEKIFQNHQKMQNSIKWEYARKRYIHIDIESDPVSCVKVSEIFYAREIVRTYSRIP